VVEVVMVQLLVQRLERGLEVGEVHHPAGLRIDRAFHVQLHPERVAVQARALVALGHVGQAMCRLEGEDLEDFHGRDCRSWLAGPAMRVRRGNRGACNRNGSRGCRSFVPPCRRRLQRLASRRGPPPLRCWLRWLACAAPAGARLPLRPLPPRLPAWAWAWPSPPPCGRRPRPPPGLRGGRWPPGCSALPGALLPQRIGTCGSKPGRSRI